MPQKKMLKMRHIQVDFIRGVAIVLMVIFHISFDLNNFHFINIDIYHALYWRYFRYLILTLFILCVGVSLVLANRQSIDLIKNFKRFSLLILLASFVSGASYFTFAQTWIYFGVLHFIAFASFFGLLFLRFIWINLLLGLSIVTLYTLSLINMHWLYEFLQLPLHLPQYTEDLVSFTPWFGVLLIGIFIAQKKLYLFYLKENSFTHSIAYFGKKSLPIYILHQPIFFGLIAGADYLLH